MGKVEITINGVAYPCRETMGAMLLFKEETGKDVSELNPASVTDNFTYFWCRVVAACEVDGIDFDLTLQQFANRIEPDAFQSWLASVATKNDAPGGGEKKSL